MDQSLPGRFWSKVDRNGPVQDHAAGYAVLDVRVREVLLGSDDGRSQGCFSFGLWERTRGCLSQMRKSKLRTARSLVRG